MACPQQQNIEAKRLEMLTKYKQLAYGSTGRLGEGIQTDRWWYGLLQRTMGTWNGVGKWKRKTRVGFRIPLTQNHNGEKTWFDPRGQSKEKNMDLRHGMPSTTEHWG